LSIRLVLADDQPIILFGLENLFRREADFEVLQRCINGEETVLAARQHRPEILILDAQMPGKDGLTVLRELKRDRLPMKVILIADALKDEQVLEAVGLGVRGMVLKEHVLQMMVQCVRTVHAGEPWLEKHAFSKALESLLRRNAGEREVSGVLTPREMEMVRLVAQGLPNREMSRQLSISEGTVKTHLHRVYRKLKVHNRSALTLYAHNKNLV
jgi:DNA-binding NarL/FixJ family response regulator